MDSLALQTLPGRPARGADGIVRAVLAACGQADGLDAARVATAVAGRAYMFTPDDNHGYRHDFPGVEWSWGSLRMDSYGVVEALGPHLERELRVYPRPTWNEVRALVLHHRTHGWSPVAVDADGCACIVASDGSDADCHDASSDDRGRVTLRGGDPAAPVAGLEALIAVREAPPTPPARRVALLKDALRFMVAHAGSGRELEFREEVYYASGLRAFDVAAAIASAPERTAGPGWAVFFDAWVADVAEGRASLAAEALRWATAPSTAPTDGDWSAVGDAYAAVAAAATALRRADAGTWSDRLAAVRDADQAAALLLKQAVQRDD